MGSDQDIGGQFKDDKGVSFTGMDFTEGKIISDVHSQMNNYSLSGTQSADSVLPYGDGMKYIVEHTSEAFWQTDREFKFTYTNAACEKVSGGFTTEDLVGKSLLEFLKPESIEQLQHVHGGRRREEKQGIKTDVIYHELQMRRKDGTYFWAGISASPIRDMNGNIVGYQGVLKDVSPFKKSETEQKRLEGLLRKTEKLASLGQMTGVITHEVNNVMAGILGFSELLMMQGNPDNEVTRDHLKNIIGSAERIIAILQDVMILSRKDDDARKSVNLNELIPVFLRRLEFQNLTGQQTGVSVNLDLEPFLHDIMASFSTLEKALLNILTVSFLQAGPGGHVSISTKTVYLGRPVDGNENICEGEYVVLSISDTGDGITDEDICHIFEPFYVRKTVKKETTGLELTIAREVIKEHNGFIDIRSKIGFGSTFTVYLPVMRAEMQANHYRMSQMDYSDRQAGIH